jgi:hypothetical protein
MYDRQTESWWQEFTGEAIVGEMTGTRLEVLPNAIVSWEEFKNAHQDGKVLSRNTGSGRQYGSNPYPGYDSYDPFLFEEETPGVLPAIERVVAIDMEPDALAVPFSVLEEEPVVHFTLSDRDLVVLFKSGTASALDDSDIAEGRDIGAVGVFHSVLDGRRLSFKVEGDGFIDTETGSAWNLLGQAVSGPLEGQVLTPIAHRSQFWFSWVVYRPDTIIYQGEGETARLTE